MKIAPAAADRFVASPPQDLRACLFYGPDGGLVRERATALARQRVEDLSDPFRVSALAGTAIAEAPGWLADEAAMLSLTGETRVVRADGVGESAHAAVEILFSRPEASTLVVLEAGELPPRSKLRKLFEDAPDAAAIACYADDAATLEAVIRATMDEAGLAISADATAFLCERLGADRKLTRSELEKLVLYAQDAGRVTLEDAALCCGDNAILTLDDLCDAAATGDLASVAAGLDRLLEEGVNPVTILRAAQRHLQRIQVTAARAAAGTSADQAMKALRPAVFFKRAPSFRQALLLWTPGRAGSALGHLCEAEATCKSGTAPPDPVCANALMSVARAAADAQRRPAGNRPATALNIASGT